MAYPKLFKTIAKKTPILGQIVDDRDRLRSDLSSANADRDHLRSDLSSANAHRDRLRSELLSANADRDRLRSELSSANADRDHLRNEHNRLRTDISKLLTIEPVFTASNQNEYLAGFEKELFTKFDHYVQELIESDETNSFVLQRFCLCCNKITDMPVDFKYSVIAEDGKNIPNFRERLVCSECQMNNRQRLIAKLVQQYIDKVNASKIYFMEQVTPIYKWIKEKYPLLEIYGSEYLGYEYQGGDVIKGIRHEDIMNLSFPNSSLELIVSNDVFEHVPNYLKAFKECYRVLIEGGSLITTIPFHASSNKSIIRAEIKNNEIKHLLPAEYHGNPLSEDGCLVFHDYGWDLLNVFSEVGFRSCCCEVYFDDRFGHLGKGLNIFRLKK